jgi:hypothetical protein
VNADAGSAAYATAILDQIPRVLSRMDRDPGSTTAGCCDRTYWAWKFTDFPGARFQEAACVLGFVHATAFPGNVYHRNANLLGWIALALRYWTTLQHRDGSFDEAYPNERSLAATAFTTFYVGETLGFVGAALPTDIAAAARTTMRRAGDWLCANDETHGFLSNHLAAAAGALAHVAVQTGDARFRARSDYFLERILAHQSSEGWYDEYGGADPGYQTHGSFYLARLQELAPQPQLHESLARAVAFQALFIHPDGSLGGEYTSRNTQTYYPAAFEMLAPTVPAAAWIARTMAPAVGTAMAAGIRAVDAWNLQPMLNNLAFALRACLAPGHGSAVAAEPGARDDFVWLPQAGLGRFRRERYVAFAGASQGGVLKVFDRGTGALVYSDCGYVGQASDGGRVASQHFDTTRTAQAEPGSLALSSSFVRVKRPTMTPWLFMGFRVFSLTLGRSAALARWLKQVLVRVLIYRKHPVGIALQRIVTFGDRAVVIRDRIKGPDLGRLRELRWLPAFTTIHMGSARYFVGHELDQAAFGLSGSAPLALDAAGGALEVERTVRFD